MNYAYKQLDESTGRIVFESSLPFDKNNKPAIGRLFYDSNNMGDVDMGTIIGCKCGKMSAYLIYVRRGDIIVLRESTHGNPDQRWMYFRVDDRFRPQHLNFPDRLITPKEACRFGAGQSTDLEQIDSSGKMMREFLEDRHPRWLRKVVATHINQWILTNDAESLFRYAPWRADQISDANLRAFAHRYFYAAFEIRTRMPPRKQAVFLSESYKYAPFSYHGRPLEDLHSDIIHSIADYPDEWLRFHGDFQILFRDLYYHVELEITTEMMNLLINEMSPGERKKQIVKYFCQNGLI